MADCNELFKKFLSEITITTEQRKNLQRGRNAIKEKIENYFSNELKVRKPEFYLQGSYALKTMVAPLNPKDEYDLDDGIYLQHTGDDTSTPTPATVSNWIMKAVQEHTKKHPKNLKNCVRVVYADGYHIDLPVYRTIKGKIHLATLEDNKWIYSDAKAFNNWFYERLEDTEQMRSCIKYLKAWKDFKGCDLKGIHITVLVGLNHTAVEDRDDESLTETVGNIIKYLYDKKAIYNPVDQSENLIEGWSVGKIAAAINDLEKLQEIALEAIEENDKSKASKKWIVAFGTRFPEHEEKTSEGKVAVAVAPLSRDPRPPAKPWSHN